MEIICSHFAQKRVFIDYDRTLPTLGLGDNLDLLDNNTY